MNLGTPQDTPIRKFTCPVTAPGVNLVRTRSINPFIAPQESNKSEHSDKQHAHVVVPGGSDGDDVLSEEIMALHSKRIDYTVYPPDYQPDAGCWDFRTVAKARLAAKKLGFGARVRRNINVIGKSPTQTDWCVERVWEWNGKEFINITKNSAKGLP
jgi:hypothetical protein